jgi:hypothetical protein
VQHVIFQFFFWVLVLGIICIAMNYDLVFHLFNEMAEPTPLRQMVYFIINKSVVFFCGSQIWKCSICKSSTIFIRDKKKLYFMIIFSSVFVKHVLPSFLKRRPIMFLLWKSKNVKLD